MKKILVAMITTILVFTTCTSCNASESPSSYVQPGVSSDTTEDPYMQEGTFNNLNEGIEPGINGNTNISATTPIDWIAEVFAFVIVLIPCSINALLCIATMPDNVPTQMVRYFTIERLLEGKIDLFDINIFDIHSSGNDTATPGIVNESSINQMVKENVAKWFYALRNFAIVALLAVLIYIGILMAISATAKDKARYKNMLANWFVSFILIFIIQYVLIIAINVSNELVKIISDISDSMPIFQEETVANIATGDSDEQKDEIELEVVFGYTKTDGQQVPGLLSNIPGTTAWTRLALVIVYSVLVYYQVKFFFIYLKRFFMVGFLTAISPLITITYSIDKAGDNQAQAYKTWFKEMMIAIFIQPIHLLFFLIFMRSTRAIILTAPIFAIILIGSLSRAESIVRKLFKVDRTNSMGSLKRKRR